MSQLPIFLLPVLDMIYNVIGLMSGSSLDGLDICYARYEEVRGKWSAEILAAECVPFSADWQDALKSVGQSDASALLLLHASFGRYIGTEVNHFIERHELMHKVHFVTSHGHTVLHNPEANTSFQLGEGASIAAITGLPVINDLRAMDVALGGQGAPIVPIGDRLLFGDYDFLLNIGGIANMSVRQETGPYIAFDIGVANQALNALAQEKGKAYDENGALAASGRLLVSALEALQGVPYYSQAAPKSLSNEGAMGLVADFIQDTQYTTEDRLHTLVHLIAKQIAFAVAAYPHTTSESSIRRMLLSGGGALNSFLVDTIRHYLTDLNVELVLPDTSLVHFKEALVMGLIGILRWREEVNVQADTTGASRSSVGGALWMGA